MTSRFLPLGDSAITVVLGDGISRELSQRVVEVAGVIRSALPEVEVVPAYASLAVFFDPLLTTYSDISATVRPLVDGTRPSKAFAYRESARTIRIPVRYDGQDLAEVAQRTGHTTDELISLHSEREYHVYVIGFVPGFAYLGEIDQSLVLPRRSEPRKRVPAGSVAIAETQTGIYPFATPGGWHLIGSTDAKMFNPSASPPALLRAGDKVIFEPAQ